jgi:leader peptidase (prepilin peptidase)/N-methyltransferase
MILYVWYVLVFLLGAVVGSFLNVCIARIPLEKSVFWPLGSRCGHCFQRIRRRDNIPLLSYWLLRGRCRTCGAPFSVRYFFVELLTALGFVGLFYLEVVANVHHWEVLEDRRFAIVVGAIPAEGWVLFGYHAVLFSFLLVVAVCDLDRREIPLSVTFTGTFVGLVGAVLWPWPWPYTPEQVRRDLFLAAHQGGNLLAPQQLGALQNDWALLPPGALKTGLYPWPFWGPLPDWCQPGDNWQTGLATGLAGVLVGSMMLRAIGYLFSKGLQKEALGLGDADLMMMAGAFLGWQPVVVAFFVGVFLALPVGIIGLLVWKDNSLPFGPSLAAGVVITWLAWERIGPHFQLLFFWRELLMGMAVVCGLFMLVSGFVIRMFRR